MVRHWPTWLWRNSLPAMSVEFMGWRTRLLAGPLKDGGRRGRAGIDDWQAPSRGSGWKVSLGAALTVTRFLDLSPTTARSSRPATTAGASSTEPDCPPPQTPPRSSPTGAHRYPPRIAASDSWRSLRDARVLPVDSADDPLLNRRCGSRLDADPGSRFRAG